MARCRHRRCWLFAANGIVCHKWCYECGATRWLKTASDKWSRWIKPVGPGGENPAVTDLDRRAKRAR
jgi:hypothetical protein